MYCKKNLLRVSMTTCLHWEVMAVTGKYTRVVCVSKRSKRLQQRTGSAKRFSIRYIVCHKSWTKVQDYFFSLFNIYSKTCAIQLF